MRALWLLLAAGSGLSAQVEPAVALYEQARHRRDPHAIREASDACRGALAGSPGDPALRKAEVSLLLLSHRFEDALEKATAYNKSIPDDVEGYGLIADASFALGRYEEAEKAIQWMLDLRRTHPAGLFHAGVLRLLTGDLEGAAEMLESALVRIQPTDSIDRAEALTWLALVHLWLARYELAEQTALRALEARPGFVPGVVRLAEVKVERRKFREAADLLAGLPPQPRHLNLLAQALESAGDLAQAASRWSQFEKAALEQVNDPDNANRELVLYYTGPKRKPAEALRIAKIEFARRQDLYTLDAYARALHANGEVAEARRQIDRLYAVGIKDPAILEHSKTIQGR